MKVPFLVKNGFTCGLNLVLNRKTSRIFSTVNLAFSPSSCSEDEAVLPEDFNHGSTSEDCVFSGGISEPYVARNCPTNEFTFPCSSIKLEESGDDEMEVMMLILEEQGLGFGRFDCHEIVFDEEYVLKALNVLFYEGGSAALPLRFFRFVECSFGLKHTVRTVCTFIRILVLGNMNHTAFDMITSVVHGHPQHIEPIQLDHLVKVFQDICTGRVLETVYSMLVRCYTLGNMMHEAIKVISLMEKVGLLPSRGVCNLLIKSLLEVDLLECALDLLDKLQGRLLVSGTTISLFIHYYCCKGNLEMGCKLLMQMNTFKAKPDVVAYTILINFLCKFSYVKEATSLVFKMIEMGVSPDVVLLTTIIDGYCKAGQLQDAMRIVKLFHIDLDVFVYDCFISKLCKDGKMEEASSLFHEMLALGILPDCFSYTTMISGYCKTKNTSGALHCFGRMLKDGIEPSVNTYTVLVSCYCRKGDIKGAQHVLQNMIGKGLMPDVVFYNSLVDGYKKLGLLDRGMQLLDIMISTGISPDRVTYNTLIHGFIIGGLLSQATELLDDLITKGLPSDAVTFTNVIYGYANQGLFEDALMVWAWMNANNVMPDVITHTVLVTGYSRARRMDKAFALFQKMVAAGFAPDLILYNSLIHGYCRIGDIEEACHLIGMMIKDNIFPSDSTYRALVVGYEKKHVTNPMETAADKLQLILDAHGIKLVACEN